MPQTPINVILADVKQLIPDEAPDVIYNAYKNSYYDSNQRWQSREYVASALECVLMRWCVKHFIYISNHREMGHQPFTCEDIQLDEDWEGQYEDPCEMKTMGVPLQPTIMEAAYQAMLKRLT